MQKNRIYHYILYSFLLLPFFANAQVNAVEFGKNRIQFKKFNWKFYQSPNFNTYFTQGGSELGKYVAQVAETELPALQTFIEYSVQRRVNIVVYNSYDEYKQSNIGLGIDWQNAGGLTKLVNNKLVLYFDGNHEHLKLQIRQGIAKVLTDNMLFGDDIGEFVSNSTLLDLPQWLTDGYIYYAAQNWSTEKDDELKSAMLSGDYNSFYQFAYAKPALAGQAFWYYIAEKYKKENVTYLLYLARIYKSLNKASLKVTKMKFKEVLNSFMQFEQDKYYKDIRGRRNAPKGNMSVTEDVSKNEYYRFQANPNPRNNNYAVVEFSKGVYRVKYIENFYDTKILLDKGVRTNLGDINPNYPILAWDVKGTRLLVIYWEAGKTKMFVYDVIGKFKRFVQTITGFDQILDASFMLDANTLVFSAVKNGHSDIYTYKIEEGKSEQITNDVYDDLNPTFVSFPNRTGIIFASNRPSANAPAGDTVLPGKYHFNIYLVDILNKNKTKQITKLTDMKYGNAGSPMQYNNNHFTFVSDENGIANRWAGFFATQRTGVDTLYYIGDEVLHNPPYKELDSTLTAWQKQEADSISYFQVYKDSTYTFPITNYQSSLLETRIAGNNGQVSETRREGDYKFLYKLKVNEDALAKRNVNAKPTEYMQQVMNIKKAAAGKPTVYKNKPKPAADTTSFAVTQQKSKKLFQNEFADEKPDTSHQFSKITDSAKAAVIRETVLSKSKMYNYRLKFSADYILSGITNNILVNTYQPYAGGGGPIQLNNGQDLNWNFRVGVSDLFEDIKFVGGYSFGTNLTDKDIFFSFFNYRKRLDWGLTYFRSNNSSYSGEVTVNGSTYVYPGELFTNLYQAHFSYPFDEVRSIRAIVGVRTDRFALKSEDPISLTIADSIAQYMVGRFEYVYDNTINPTQNIWNGTRWKIYMDMMSPINNSSNITYNLGFDYRHYVKIYRNFIWAGRAAGDFSWGKQKVIYYLGGVDGWVGPKFNNNNTPAPDQTYAFQSLAVNMRGYNQNIANGNNDVVLNSEFRLPVFATLFNKPINNAFVRNFEVTQFFDLGTAWNGKYNGITRPTAYYGSPGTGNPVLVKMDAGGIGPFAAGYGFGVRSTLLGYFMKVDAGWPMIGFFKGSPVWYFALGLDF